MQEDFFQVGENNWQNIGTNLLYIIIHYGIFFIIFMNDLPAKEKRTSTMNSNTGKYLKSTIKLKKYWKILKVCQLIKIVCQQHKLL